MNQHGVHGSECGTTVSERLLERKCNYVLALVLLFCIVSGIFRVAASKYEIIQLYIVVDVSHFAAALQTADGSVCSDGTVKLSSAPAPARGLSRCNLTGCGTIAR